MYPDPYTIALQGVETGSMNPRLAANVAPTEEIQVIAAGSSPVRLLGLVLVSLMLGGGILFYSNFVGTARRGHRD